MTITAEYIRDLNERLDAYTSSRPALPLPPGWRFSVSHLGQALSPGPLRRNELRAMVLWQRTMVRRGRARRYRRISTLTRPPFRLVGKIGRNGRF